MTKNKQQVTVTLPFIKADAYYRDYEASDDEWPVEPYESDRNGKGFQIDLTQMYERPTVKKASYSLLVQLAGHFGTDRIDIDEISESGCESCDYGSRYGYTIEVYGATKNVPQFEDAE